MFAVITAQIFILVSAGISTPNRAEKLKTHLIIVSCPDGKPSEEAPKGRGRGFGGENTQT